MSCDIADDIQLDVELSSFEDVDGSLTHKVTKNTQTHNHAVDQWNRITDSDTIHTTCCNINPPRPYFCLYFINGQLFLYETVHSKTHSDATFHSVNPTDNEFVQLQLTSLKKGRSMGVSVTAN